MLLVNRKELAPELTLSPNRAAVPPLSRLSLEPISLGDEVLKSLLDRVK